MAVAGVCAFMLSNGRFVADWSYSFDECGAAGGFWLMTPDGVEALKVEARAEVFAALPTVAQATDIGGAMLAGLFSVLVLKKLLGTANDKGE